MPIASSTPCSAALPPRAATGRALRGGEASETPLEDAGREAWEEAGIPTDARFMALDSLATMPVVAAVGFEWGADVLVIPEHSFGVEVGDEPLALFDEHDAVKWLGYEAARAALRWESNRNALWELNHRLTRGANQGMDAPRAPRSEGEAMDVTRIHQDNAAFWDETAAWYAERDEAEDIAFLRAGGNALAEAERRILGDLAPWCKRAVHLQCSHGRDAISLLRQGAAEVVGIDISARLLAAARRKAEALGVRACFVQADILETPHDLDGTADLVYTGKGALCWMMDLGAWARVVARLLRPGGLFFVHEAHPLDWVWDTHAEGYVLDPDHGDYFSLEPRQRLFTPAVRNAPRYRQWTLGDVVNALVGAGLSVESLSEHPEPFWSQFPHVSEDTLRRLPHTFTLTARARQH